MARRGTWLDRFLTSLGLRRSHSRFGRRSYGRSYGFGRGYQRRGYGFGGLSRWASLLGLGYLGRRYYMNRRAHTADTSLHDQGYVGV
jgi:hypothetical protein